MAALPVIEEENVGLAFWKLEQYDPNGDPLELLIECEAEDIRSHKERWSTYHEFIETHRNSH